MIRRVLVIALFSVSLTLAASLPTAAPESVGVSAQRLKRIDTWLSDLVASKHAAGFVSLVARRGKIVHHEAFGTRGFSVTDPMPKDALFDLASMTKPVTVAAALMLLEEGSITLHEPISTHLPEFKNVRVETAPGVLSPPARPIQVRDLFSHTSGVFPTRSRAEIFEHPTLQSFMQELARTPLRAQPGSTWLYGTSHDVLGYLVQQVSGQPLDQFIKQRILSPLTMNDTYYWPPDSVNNRRAILVVDGKDDPESLSRVPAAAAKAKTYIGGASGLYSTAADYFRFSQMLLNGGVADGQRLLSPKTIAWLAQNHIGDIGGFRTPGTRFGLGFAVVTDPAASGLPYSQGTYYWSGSQGTIFWIDPKEKLVGLLMVQLTPSRLQLREKFSALVYSSLVE
jgi:CubicO group peptidase (beta-lactamase class C family)